MKNYFKIFLVFILFYSSAYSFDARSVQDGPGWWCNTTNQSHSFAIPLGISIKINTDTTFDVGDYIGVFYDKDGTLTCGGYAMWTGQNIYLNAWAKDSYDSTGKNGFTDGETIHWRVYKKLSGITYDVQVTVMTGPSVFASGGVSVLSAITSESAVVDVKPPWYYTNTTGISHSIAIPVSANLKIVGVKIQKGDYIGAFYDSSGTTACGGYTLWDITQGNGAAVTAWGDDDQTTVKEGFYTGEKLQWKLWRASDKKEFSAKAYYSHSAPNDSLFVSNGLSALDSLIADTSSSVTPPPDTSTVVDTFITISCNIQFGDGDITKTKNYKIIGLPGKGTADGSPITLENTIFYGRIPNEDWVAFKDDGTGEYISYNSANKSKFNFLPGNACWVLSRYPFKINPLKVKCAVHSTDKTYKIPLTKGWNMISNPFTDNVDWNSLSTLNNNLSDPIWDYNENGSFVLPTGFVPYRGYYFYNRRGLDSLIIPVPATESAKIKPAKNSGITSLPNPLKIYLLDPSGEVSSAYITIVSGASNALDDYDQFAPPSNFESASVCLYNDALDSDYKNLFIEARPEIGKGQAFDIKVKHTAGGVYTLQFSGLENYPLSEAFLINKRTLEFFDLKQDNTISINNGNSSDEFILAMGSKEFFRSIKADIKPVEYALYQNYPNPFNPSTVISWQLAADSRVTVKVYNLLGKEIATLLDDAKKATGQNSVTFSVNNLQLPSGIYFYSIRATALDGSSHFNAVRKMLVIK